MSIWKAIKTINLSQVFSRFGLALAFSIFACFSIISLIYTDAKINVGFFEDIHLVKLILCLVIGFLLAIIWRIFNEYYVTNSAIKWLSLLLVFLPVLSYYLWLRPNDLDNGMVILRFIGFVLFLHAVISFLPFLIKDKIASFWEYNRILFTHFFISLFFTGVLFAGVSLAIFALEFLFDMPNFKGKIYGYWFVLMAGVFHPIYFLSHFPRAVRSIHMDSLPRAFVILVVYILIPISLLYLAILYSYGAKIAIEMSLPEGMVSNLVLSFSIIGILTYLLNYMIPSQGNLVLSRFFRKYFFYLMLIPIALLLTAIYTRIGAYGITEPRYIVAILSLWLLLVSIYIIFSKTDNIKVIPISLSIVVLISLLGPFNMFHLSIKNQYDRLESNLAAYGILTKGQLTKGVALEQEYADQIRSQIEFLVDRENGLERLGLLSSDLKYKAIISIDSSMGNFSRRKKLENYLGFTIINNKDNYNEFYKNFYASSDSSIDISDYSLMIPIHAGVVKEDRLSLSQKGQSCLFTLRYRDKDLDLDLKTFVNSLLIDEERRLSYDDLTYIQVADEMEIEIVFEKIGIDFKADTHQIRSYNGYLFLKEKTRAIK